MTLCILGAGGHGVSVWDAAHTQYKHIFFLSKEGGGELCGCRIFPQDQPCLPLFDELIVAVGDNEARMQLTYQYILQGARLATVIHPSAYVSAAAEVSPGSCVLAQAAVNAGAWVGPACIVNTGAVVEHECVLGSGVHLSPRAALGGSCMVGDGAWIGIGASVVHGVKIGEQSVVAAGAAVTKDVPPHCMVAGVPAVLKKQL